MAWPAHKFARAFCFNGLAPPLRNFLAGTFHTPSDRRRSAGVRFEKLGQAFEAAIRDALGEVLTVQFLPGHAPLTFIAAWRRPSWAVFARLGRTPRL